MKTDILFSLYWNKILTRIPIVLIALVSISCNPEIIDPDPQDPPDNSVVGPEKFLFTIGWIMLQAAVIIMIPRN